MALSDFEILAWSSGKRVIKRIAAFLAVQIRDGRLTHFDELPDTDELAREWDTTRKIRNGRFYVA